MNKFMAGLTVGMIITACFFIIYKPFQHRQVVQPIEVATGNDSIDKPANMVDRGSSVRANPVPSQVGDKINRDSLVSFAKSLIGVPYLYGSTDPAKGFDCSGFITYVFNHFNMTVPRSSFDFENKGRKVTMDSCKRGDIILFTGTVPEEKNIGHIGIICDSNEGIPSFIHSTSGKANGVTITSMENKFYLGRFVGIVDLLGQ